MKGNGSQPQPEANAPVDAKSRPSGCALALLIGIPLSLVLAPFSNLAKTFGVPIAFVCLTVFVFVWATDRFRDRIDISRDPTRGSPDNPRRRIGPFWSLRGIPELKGLNTRQLIELQQRFITPQLNRSKGMWAWVALLWVIAIALIFDLLTKPDIAQLRFEPFAAAALFLIAAGGVVNARVVSQNRSRVVSHVEEHPEDFRLDHPVHVEPAIMTRAATATLTLCLGAFLYWGFPRLSDALMQHGRTPQAFVRLNNEVPDFRIIEVRTQGAPYELLDKSPDSHPIITFEIEIRGTDIIFPQDLLLVAADTLQMTHRSPGDAAHDKDLGRMENAESLLEWFGAMGVDATSPTAMGEADDVYRLIAAARESDIERFTEVDDTFFNALTIDVTMNFITDDRGIDFNNPPAILLAFLVVVGFLSLVAYLQPPRTFFLDDDLRTRIDVRVSYWGRFEVYVNGKAVIQVRNFFGGKPECWEFTAGQRLLRVARIANGNIPKVSVHVDGRPLIESVYG